MKRTALLRRTPLRKTRKSTLSKKLPEWIRYIPPSYAHGSGILQHKLWRVVSDYVRIRDWHAHGGRVVDMPGMKLARWTNGQAGHFKSYGTCNGIFKFDPVNIHLQSPSGNAWGGQDIGHAFGEELKRRYGPDILEDIERKNRTTSLKFSDGQIISLMTSIIANMRTLPEQPDYLAKIPA